MSIKGYSRKRKLLPVLLSAVLLTAGLSMAVYADENSALPGATVTIYATNDIHGAAVGSNSAIGLARTAGIAASTENSILVDAGDATQGASFATVTQGADVIQLMNAAGYDVMAAGNHEFDYGADRLLSNAALAEFPILGANVLRDGESMLTPHAIIESAGRRIGFIGLTTTATASSTNPSQLAGVSFGSEVAAAKEQIALLRDQTDAIVLVCHMGDNSSAVPCTSGQLLAALSDAERAEVNAVIDGHSHTLENMFYTAGGVSIPVIQTGTGFVNLGVVTLTFEQNGHVTAAGNLMDYAEAMAYPLNAAGTLAAHKVETALKSIEAEQKKELDQVLCTAATPLWGGYVYYDYAEPRIAETSYGDFVTDAFLSDARVFAALHNLNQPVIAVENGGGISATLPVGEVTRGDVLDAFNHGNTVDVIEVTPNQLYTALEEGLTMTGQDASGMLIRNRVSGSFLQVSGFSYAYDPAGASGSKVTSVVLDNGTVLRRNDESTKLIAATNNYVTTFEGFKDGRKLGELGGEDQIVEEYILEMTAGGTTPLSIPVTAGRIRIVNDKSPSAYQVSVPVKNSKNADISLAGQMVHLKVDDGNVEEYVVDEDGALHVTLTKGPHTLYLLESEDGIPVYVNNYSGSGTATTRDGYYRLAFLVDGTALSQARASGQEEDWAGIPKINGTWLREPRGWRYCSENGAYLAGCWAYLDWNGTDSWYYFDPDSYLHTGWLEYDGKWYYLHPLNDGSCGYMYTGRHLIDGVWYKFSEDPRSPMGALLQ